VRHAYAYLLQAAGLAKQHVFLQLALAPAADLARGLAALARRPLRSLCETQSVELFTHVSVGRAFVRHAYAHLLGAAELAEQHVLLQLALAPAADLVRGLAALARRPLRSLRVTHSVKSDTFQSLWYGNMIAG